MFLHFLLALTKFRIWKILPSNSIKEIYHSSIGSWMVIHSFKFVGWGSDAAAMPRLVAHLSSELTLHGRELRAGRLQAVGSEPVFLAVLSQLIEVLDTLVPLPNLPENSLVLGKDWSLGGEIRPQYTESLLESLRQAFGSHGFLPECVECLRCINQTELPYIVMDELKLVTLLALRLALAWDTPSTVQRPLEVMIECKGYEVLLDHLLQLIASFKGDVSETTLPQMALALEAVYLMLCSDSGLEQLCGSESLGPQWLTCHRRMFKGTCGSKMMASFPSNIYLPRKVRSNNARLRLSTFFATSCSFPWFPMTCCHVAIRQNFTLSCSGIGYHGTLGPGLEGMITQRHKLCSKSLSFFFITTAIELHHSHF